MNARIIHRGPDDQGTFADPAAGIGLAHRRLSIIDTSSRGHQPMWDLDRRVVIVYNGEIYNYQGLRQSLLDQGYRFQSETDTEVLLNLYLAKGTEMLNDLNGMFAFALWDAEQKHLLIARDGVGIKPLYYAATPKGLVFASELKALLETPDLDISLNRQAIMEYLTFIWCPAPDTLIKSVRKLEPGNALLVRDGAIIKHWSFYRLPFDSPIRNIPEQQAKSELSATLKQSIARQMIADVPVGFFLSGGVDSSTVVALAKDVMGGADAFECFTIGVPGGQAQADGFDDDLPYAQAVAKHLGIKLNTVTVSHEITTQAIEHMLYHLDEPIADPAAINVYLISQLAREHGIKVLLSGAGGDDIFTGYRRHYALEAERYWAWLPKAIRRSVKDLTGHLTGVDPLSRRIRKAFQYADADPIERLVSYFCWCPPSLVSRLVKNENGDWGGRAQPHQRVIDSVAALPDTMPPVNKMLYVDQKYYLADECLAYTDKMSMAASLEVRVPLLDREMVQFAAQLPVQYKQRGSISKWLLKQVAQDYLPSHIVHRSKVGFGVPLRRWMRHELRPMVNDLLAPASLEASGVFNPQEVQNLLKADHEDRGDWSYVLFGIMCIELWHRMLIKGR